MTIEVYVGGVNRSAWFDKRTLVIEDTFGAKGKTARGTITVDTNAALAPARPLAGEVFRIVVDGTEEFEGPIVAPTDNLFNPDVYNVDVTGEDYTLWLDRKLVSAKIARPSELAGGRIKFFLGKFCPDFAEGNIQGGDTVPSQSYDYVEMSSILDELAETCDYAWWVDTDRRLYFVPEVTEIAPIAAIDLDTELHISGAAVTEDWSDLHNVLILKDFKLYSEEYHSYRKKADGVQTFFGLPYAPWSVKSTSVRVKDQTGAVHSRTVEEDKSVVTGETNFLGEAGKAYVCLSNWGVRFPQADPPDEDDIVYVDYAYTLQDQSIIEKDLASIAVMAARTGTDGEFEKMLSAPNMKAASLNDARYYCQMLLARGAWPVWRGSFTTYLSGWESGQTFTLHSAKRNIEDVQNPGNPVRVWVQSVTKTVVVLADGESVRFRSEVEFSSKPFTARMSMEKFLKALIDRQDRSQPVGDVAITTTSTSTTSTSTTTSTGTSTSSTTTLADRALLLEPATPGYTTSSSTSTTTTTVTGTSTSSSTTTTLGWTSPDSVYDVCGEGTGAADNFIDGDTTSYWSHNADHVHEIVLDMGVSKTVEKIRVYVWGGLSTSQWTGVHLYVSDDPLSWHLAKWNTSFTRDTDGWVERTMTNHLKGRYIQVIIVYTQSPVNHLLGTGFEAYLTG